MPVTIQQTTADHRDNLCRATVAYAHSLGITTEPPEVRSSRLRYGTESGTVIAVTLNPNPPMDTSIGLDSIGNTNRQSSSESSFRKISSRCMASDRYTKASRAIFKRRKALS